MSENANDPKNNRAVLTVAQIIKSIMSLAAEAELGALFHNGQVAEPIRTCLAEMGHLQPCTPMKTDNSTAAGIINSSIREKKSKAMDMRFFWIKDRVTQKNV